MAIRLPFQLVHRYLGPHGPQQNFHPVVAVDWRDDLHRLSDAPDVDTVSFFQGGLPGDSFDLDGRPSRRVQLTCNVLNLSPVGLHLLT